jgi:hypothetical protein
MSSSNRELPLVNYDSIIVYFMLLCLSPLVSRLRSTDGV